MTRPAATGRRSPSGRPPPAPRLGRAWEITIERVGPGARPRHWRLVLAVDQQSFAALAQAPELFTRLGKARRGNLDDVVALLKLLGADDETDRKPEEG
jgi:hypothetical protein